MNGITYTCECHTCQLHRGKRDSADTIKAPAPSPISYTLSLDAKGWINGLFQSCTVSVYLDDGRVFEFDVGDAEALREFAAGIIREGYTRIANGVFTYYPPHRIVKVEGRGPNITTKYPDRVRGV